MLYDIIRFFSNGKEAKLIISGVTEEQRDEWCKSPKTSKSGIWFDGFTTHDNGHYSCQSKKPLYPSNYTPDDLK